MSHKTMLQLLAVVFVMITLSACSSITKMTIREHSAEGKTVSVGQFKPTEEYGCSQKDVAKHSWGFKGYFAPSSARDGVDTEVMKKAPGMNANYVYIDAPAQVWVVGIPINLFKDATATYYNCKKVPS